MYIFILAVVVLFVKYIPDGWIEYYSLHRKKWMPDYCQVCFVFWLFTLIALIYEKIT